MDIIVGGIIAIASSVLTATLTMGGTLYRDRIQAKREKEAREQQELLTAYKAFLRGVEIRRSHMLREWLEKEKLPAEVVTEGLQEVIRGNADVMLLTSSRRVADAADELWRSLYEDRKSSNVVNERRAAFITAIREELDMPQFPYAE